jgi:hypothetical protein
VREYDGNGSPHYHFVVDKDRVDPLALSVYWSGLHGQSAKNSIRLGSKPDKEGKRFYHLTNRKHSFYLSKYLGKSFEQPLELANTVKGRKFGMAKNVAIGSKPITYRANFHFTQPTGNKVLTTSGAYVDEPIRCLGTSYVSDTGQTFNKHLYKWKKSEKHNVFFGHKQYD